MKRRILAGPCLSLGLVFACLSPYAVAAVAFLQDKVIYPERSAGVDVPVQNRGGRAVEIQGWVGDRDENDPLAAHAPFVLAPSTARLAPRQTLRLRIVHQTDEGEFLPSDRESMFYVNVLDTAVGTKAPRAKQAPSGSPAPVALFYRPKDLPGTPEQAAGTLIWEALQEGGRNILRVTNPSAYHIAIRSVALTSGVTASGGTVLPHGTTKFDLSGAPAPKSPVSFEWIDDSGKARSGAGSLGP